MATPTPTLIALDQADPWGFEDAPTVRMVIGPGGLQVLPPVGLAAVRPTPLAPADLPDLEIVDEVVDEADLPATLALATVLPFVPPPPATPPPAAEAVSNWMRFSGRDLRGVPFQREALALLGLFLAVIVMQVLYLGLSLTGEAAAAPRLGEVVLSSHPSGAEVMVDDRLHGVTPMALALPAGVHSVEVTTPGLQPVRRTLDVEPGQRRAEHVVLAAVTPVPAPSAPAVAPPVRRAAEPRPAVARVVTSTRPVATHTAARGESGVLTVPVQLNALPWAEVTIDGRPQGETPIANLQLAVGAHRVVFRHPDLGEQVEVVTVRAGGPNRLAVDLRR